MNYQYMLCTSESVAELEKNVEDCMKEGWQPQGGVIDGSNGDGFFLLQAMVKA